MSGKITQERLEAIRQRAEKATKGPWSVDEYHVELFSGEDRIASMTNNVTWDNPNEVADSEFIAHARQDIPDLLAEVEAKKNQIESLSDAYTELHSSYWSNMLENYSLKAEVESLKYSLRRINEQTMSKHASVESLARKMKEIAKEALSNDD